MVRYTIINYRIKMPLYCFSCSKCGHKAEKLMSMKNRKDSIECSKCGSKAIRVVAIPSPANFKGKGWTEKFHK